MGGVDVRATVGRLSAALRERGAAGLASKLLDGLDVYRRLVVVDVPLAPSPARPFAGPGRVTVRRLETSAEDLQRYHRLRPDQAASLIRARLDAGVACFVTLLDDALVSAIWAARGRAHVDYLGCDLEMGPDDGYAYDSFTAPEHRGADLASWCSELMRRSMAAAGCRRLFGMQMRENANAVRRSARRAHTVLGVARVVGIGPWRRAVVAPAWPGGLPATLVLRPCRGSARECGRWHSS